MPLLFLLVAFLVGFEVNSLLRCLQLELLLMHTSHEKEGPYRVGLRRREIGPCFYTQSANQVAWHEKTRSSSSLCSE